MKKKLLRARYQSGEGGYASLDARAREAREAFVAAHAPDTALVPQRCVVCQGTEMTVVGEIDRYGFYYPTGLCDCCGTVQQALYYPEEVLADFYAQFYRRLYGHPQPDGLFAHQRRMVGPEISAAVAPLVTPQTVLEVGCGAGGTLSVFRDQGCRVLGLDFDRDYLAAAGRNGVETRRGSLEQLQPGETFDLIIVCHVLEHISDPLAFLLRLRDHLSPGGVLYIEVPSLNDVSDGAYQFDLRNYWHISHKVHFSSRSLALLGKRAGLTCLQADQRIASCWGRAEAPQPLTAEEMAASLAENTALLEQIERNRTSLKVNPRFVVRAVRRFALRQLDRLGLKDTVKRMLS